MNIMNIIPRIKNNIEILFPFVTELSIVSLF